MKILLSLAAVVAVGLGPALSYGATYFYVATSGEVETVEAPNATVALNASASNRAADSGVALDTGAGLEEGDEVASVNGAVRGAATGNLTPYQYVDVTGDVDFVYATSPATAIDGAPNRAHDSGVVYAENEPISEDVEVNM